MALRSWVKMQGARTMATIKRKASNAPEDTGTQQAPLPKATPRGPGSGLQSIWASSHRSREGEEARGLHQGGGRPAAQGGKYQRRSWRGFRTAVEEDQRWSRR